MIAVKTSYRACERCHTRLLIIRGVPALNYGEDPAGNVAVTLADPRRGRFLARGEEPDPLERRYSVHQCATPSRHRQRRHEARRAAEKRGRAQPGTQTLFGGEG